MQIEDVKNSLDQNKYLTEDVKDNLFELILIFQKYYPNISLELLTERLKTLQVEIVNKYISDEAILYNHKTNVLQINQTELENTNNTKHMLMVSLFHIVTLDDKDEEGLLTALRDGYAHIMADNLVGSEEE